MRIGIQLPHTGSFVDAVEEVVQLEDLGLDSAFVPEAYSFDAVSQLGYLAARTHRVTLASGVMPIYTRTPALLAMTAAGLDHVSEGRFMLGIGASGPQVVEGFHGVAYDAPLARTREIIDICRTVWRREPLDHQGRYYTAPLRTGTGTGLGKPLKLINHPTREHIPILVAGTGPRNVELAAERADVWEPILFHPERAERAWGEPLANGRAKRSASLGDLGIAIIVSVAVVEDPTALVDGERPRVALYVGGMGARGKNFYNDLTRRYGFEDAATTVQDLYLAGRKREAEAAVPLDLLRDTTLIGPRSYVAERLAAFAEAGVTTVIAEPVEPSPQARRASLEALLAIA